MCFFKTEYLSLKQKQKRKLITPYAMPPMLHQHTKSTSTITNIKNTCYFSFDSYIRSIFPKGDRPPTKRHVLQIYPHP